MLRILFWLLLFPVVADAARQNLLLITIDTLRADHLGCYGNRTVSTPNLDALAKESMFFENAVCPAPLTLPSHTSLMTGRYPYHHGVQDNAGFVNERETTLAEILKRNGYHTYAFVGGFPLDHRFGLDQGFDLYNDSFPREKHRSLDFRSERGADAVVKAVLNTQIAEPFLVWIHFYDPHAPYLHGGYGGEIAFVDQQIGLLFRKWNPANTIIAVAGDHGESLGEHGELTHRIFVYDSTMRVPFWIKASGVASQRVKEQVRLIDFLPTVLSLMNLPLPLNRDGVVLPQNAGAPAYLESLFPQLQLGWSPLAAIRTAEWKYIDAPRPELYDLRSDPAEKLNLFVKKPEIVQMLRARIPNSETPTPNPELSPEMAEQLAALGYVSGSTAGIRSTIDPKDRIGTWNQIEKAVDLEETKPGESLAILEKAQKSDPDNPMILSFLAQKYAEAGQLEPSKQILSRIIARDPKNSLALYRMAIISLQAGQPAEARKWADSLHKLDPRNADAMLLLARANIRLKNFETAAQNLAAALEIDPEDLETRNDLANLHVQNNRLESAQELFEQVLRTDPKNIQALNGSATCFYLAHNYSAGETQLKFALTIAPEDPQTLMNLALLYASQGKKQEAASLYRQVAASPQAPSEWKEEALSRLRELGD